MRFRDSQAFKFWLWWMPLLVAWYVSQLIFDWDARVYAAGLFLLLAVYFAVLRWAPRRRVRASAITNTPFTPMHREHDR